MTTNAFSSDGKAWSAVADSPGIDWLAGDATDLFGARGAYFARTSAKNPKTWTELPKPSFPKPDNVQGWGIEWDPDHRLLYSIHSVNGFWRMVVQ
jgi:hypothetical protein